VTSAGVRFKYEHLVIDPDGEFPMPAPLPRYALESFVDEPLGLHVKKGDEFAIHDPIVELRPDLFTTDKPAKAEKKKEA
jgi:hypothetical protein